MNGGTAIAVAVALLIGNAFFVGAEFALISARRSRIEPRADAGDRRARATLRAMEQVSMMMTGAQLGITVCSLGLGAIGEPAVAHLLEPAFETVGVPDGLVHPISFTIALAIVVYLHMVLGEMVPKNIALAGPERAAMLLGPALAAVVGVLKPLIWTLNRLANLVLRLLRVEPRDEIASAFTAEEVAGMLAESRREGLLEDTEHELLQGALELAGKRARDLILPLERLVTVTTHTTPAEVEDLAGSTGFSRFPVVADTGDLVGYVHVKDVLTPRGSGRLATAISRYRPLPGVSADTSVEDIVQIMQSKGSHLGQVMDPATGTPLGVLALEDALEELIGEVIDPAHRQP